MKKKANHEGKESERVMFTTLIVRRLKNGGKVSLKSSSFDNVEAHFAGICGLQFHLNSIQFPLESVLGARINHLISHYRCVGGPSKQRQTDNLSSYVCLQVLRFDLCNRI